MATQEGIIIVLFAIYMQIRIKYGIGANKVPVLIQRHKAQPKWPCL